MTIAIVAAAVFVVAAALFVRSVRNPVAGELDYKKTY